MRVCVRRHVSARVHVHAWPRDRQGRAGPCTAEISCSPGLTALIQPFGSFAVPLEHPSLFMLMRPSSFWEEWHTCARTREHASTYYCTPSYCTAVLPPGLPRRQDLHWEGACRFACGSAGLPRSPWCSRPKLTMGSNHLGKIQKSPISFSESPAPRKPTQHWPGRPCNVPTAQPQNWDVF